MRALYTLLFLLTLSCQNGNKEAIFNSQNRLEVKLIDSLGSVSIDYPERTDTFFSWIQRSDCGKPCEYGDYRFQSKKNRIFQESGFYWIGEPEDSVDQLTIYHQRPARLSKHNDSSIFRNQYHLREEVFNDPETANVLSDTMMKIGDRHFYILRIADINKIGVRHRRLIAFTTISGCILEFQYKLLTRRYDSVLTTYFERSIKNLATVRIKDGS